MTEPAVIAIDVGTSSVKALLVGRSGRTLATGRAAYPTRQPVEGWSEQDPADWRKAAIEAVRACRAASDARVEAISFSGHMSAPVLVGEGGEPLGPCHTITDRRALAEVEAIPPGLVERLAVLSGNLPATHLILPKLLWWKRHHPETWDRTRAVLMPKDWLRLWMTGVVATDPTDAGNSMLYDPRSRAWSDELAREAGIDPDKLPPLVDSEGFAGGLLPGPASAFDLPEGLPVVMGAADMAATLLGTGVDLAEDVALTIGTSATVVAGLSRVEPSLVGAMNINQSVDPGVLYAIGSHFGGGGALTWLADLLAGDGGGPAFIAALGTEAGAIEPGAEGLVFLPYLSGAGSPNFDPLARGAFLGLSMKHGGAHMLRAIVEGVTADAGESIARLTAIAPRRRVVFSGGGSRIAFWPQLLADMVNLPVVPSSTADASAFGAALIAGVAVGWFPDFAAARRLAAPDAAAVLPADRARGEALRARFARAMAARRLDLLPMSGGAG